MIRFSSILLVIIIDIINHICLSIINWTVYTHTHIFITHIFIYIHIYRCKYMYMYVCTENEVFFHIHFKLIC